MRVLVTGGCGFIGHHTVRRLVEMGHDVHVLDICDRTAVNLEIVKATIPQGQLYRGDVCDSGFVESVFGRTEFDVVFHLAAQSHVDRSVIDPSGTVNTNVVGTQVIVSACVRHDARLLYCSTDEVYGDSMETGFLQVKTEKSVLNPSSPYSAGKAGGELVVRAAGRTHGLKWAITRGTNAWGPGQYGEKLVPIIVHHLINGIPVPLHGGGLQVRQWIAVEEFADALVKVGNRLAVEHDSVLRGTFNIAGPVVYSVRELVEMFASVYERISGREQTHVWVSVADRPGQDRAYFVSGRHLGDSVGCNPSRNILNHDEIERLIRAYASIAEVEPTLYEVTA